MYSNFVCLSAYNMCVYSSLIESVHTFGEFHDAICCFHILYKEAVLHTVIGEGRHTGICNTSHSTSSAPTYILHC